MNLKTFKEGYSVKYDYRKPDGYWRIGAIEDVFVKVVHGVNEKNNHDKADKVILEKHPKVVIHKISYL